MRQETKLSGFLGEKCSFFVQRAFVKYLLSGARVRVGELVQRTPQ